MCHRHDVSIPIIPIVIWIFELFRAGFESFYSFHHIAPDFAAYLRDSGEFVFC
jgi:hypothetical protein